jgi:Tol biopolymer transport system component
MFYIPGPSGSSTNLREIALADRAGTVTPLKIAAGNYVHVRASRDGKRLAVGSDDGKEAIVWIYELDGASALRRLTLEGHNRFPIWSADAERVAFQSDREGDLSIFMQRADGAGQVERLTKAEKDTVHVPHSWSPDGRHLAFTILKGGALSIWTLSTTDMKVERFGDVQSAEPIEPVFSPDGKWIAYVSSGSPGGAALTGNSPNRGVFIQPFPATGARYQVPKQGLDFHPLWSNDGRQLIWIPTGASGRIAITRVTTQPAVTFGSPETVPARVTAERLSGEARAHDILPDGRFVGLATPASSDAQLSAGSPIQFRVVVNWFEELKQRVPIK